MAFVKALVPGLIITFVVALILGSNGTTGAWLDIFGFTVQGQHLYWSWPLFLASTGLSWALFWMME